MPPHTITTRNTPLSDYVRAFREREGLSHNRLAAACRDPETGERILVQWLINLINDRLTDKAPEMWRLRALAAGITAAETSTTDPGIRYRQHLDAVKKLAAIQWLDLGDVIDMTTSDGSVITITVPPDLPESARQLIRERAEALAKRLADDLSGMD